MEQRFSFEVEPFELRGTYESGAEGEWAGFEIDWEEPHWEGEVAAERRRRAIRTGRRAGSRASRARLQPGGNFRPRPPTQGVARPPVRGPVKFPGRFPPRRIPPRFPRFPVVLPLTAISDPLSAEPSPQQGSEHVRWVQSSLNQILGLNLPLDGVMGVETRSAVRSFQKKQGLPADGFVGPDTERALLAARSGQPSNGRPGQTVQPDTAGATNGGGAPASQAGPGDNGSAPPADQASPPEASPSQEVGTWGAFEGEDSSYSASLRAGAASISRSKPRGKVGDREVGQTLAMAGKMVPGLGITLEELLLRHKADSGDIPVEVLLAFIRKEAGTHLFGDATAGKWNEKYQKYIPSFYELGIFQTPAGAHGCTKENGKKTCKYDPPGFNVEKSQFGKGWYRLKRAYPTRENWRDPIMQVRIGLWDLNSTGERIAREFPALFPSKSSEWYLRMAVLYSFSKGAGWTRAYLRKYKNELLALPENQRWEFLRGKPAYLKGRGTKPQFDPENVNEKMALAAKLRAVRGVKR